MRKSERIGPSSQLASVQVHVSNGC